MGFPDCIRRRPEHDKDTGTEAGFRTKANCDVLPNFKILIS